MYIAAVFKKSEYKVNESEPLPRTAVSSRRGEWQGEPDESGK